MLTGAHELTRVRNTPPTHRESRLGFGLDMESRSPTQCKGKSLMAPASSLNNLEVLNDAIRATKSSGSSQGRVSILP